MSEPRKAATMTLVATACSFKEFTDLDPFS